jgi:hypothetical protein
MPLHFNEDITERIKNQKELTAATAAGKTLKQWKEDRDYFNEIKEIETEEIAENKALASNEDYAPESIPLHSSYRKGLQRIKGPPVKESTVGGLEDLGGDALPVIQAEGLMRGREFKENQTPSLSPETELTGESINPWDVNKSSETGEYAIGHSPWSGPAEEPIGGGLEDLGKEAHSKGNVDKALERMRIREYEESQNPPSLTPEDPELAGVRTEGWLDSTIEEPMGMLDDLRAEKRAGEFGDVGRDENDPAVKEMKEIQTNDEVRKEVLKDVPKEEIAMVKEELGNYYIGPGGYAINLDKVDADSKRGANFLMLQHVPVHARAQMLASWGYIDQEDVDKLPDSPTVQVAKINAETEIAKQTASNKTDLTKTDKVTQRLFGLSDRETKATKELNTSNNTLKRELALSDDEFRKLDLEDKNWRFMETQELTAYMHNNGIDLDEKKLAALQDYQYAQINLGYSKIRSVEKVEANMLTFKNKQWGDQYKIANKQERRAMLLQEHTKGMDIINMAMDNGQLDFAAVTAQQMGLPFIPDYKAYATAHAKASNTDPNVKAVLDKYFPDMKASVVAGQYATYKNGRMKHYGSAAKDDGSLSSLDNWLAADPTRGKSWSDMTAPEKEQYNSREHWRAKKIVEAVNSDLRNSAYNQYHTAVTNRTMPDINPSGKDTDDTTTTTTTTTTDDKKAPEEATPEAEPVPITGAPLEKIKDKIRNTIGYGIEHVKKNAKQSRQEKVSDSTAFKKSLKEGEKRARQMLGGARKKGKTRRFQNMKQLINHYKNNPEELASRGDHFQHFILTQQFEEKISTSTH